MMSRWIVLPMILIACSATAQVKQLNIRWNDESHSTNTLKESYSDEKSAITDIKKLVGELRASGYLLASLDTVYSDSNFITAAVYKGQQYRWANMEISGLPDGWKEELRLFRTHDKQGVISSAVLGSEINAILKYGENHGYPFIAAMMEDVEIDLDIIHGRLKVVPNARYTMDTIDLRGDAKVSKTFLYSYLGFKPGEYYNESKIEKITEKLRRLPYLNPGIQVKVYFVQQKARVMLSLKQRKTDQIDGIIGFAPNASATNELLITGEANIDLKNLFKRGIAYNMHWKSFQERSQELRIGGSYPFLFQSPLGIDVGVEYVKFDTLFFNLKSQFGSRFYLSGTDYVKAYVQNHNTSLISVDTNRVRQRMQVPESNSLSIRSYGVEANISRLDYPINPRKGFTLLVNGNIGSREVLKDIRVEEVLFYNEKGKSFTVYDSATLKTRQGEVHYDAQYFIPIGSKSTLVPAVSGKHLLTTNVFFNDLYRFGGTKSLRGFNEESLLSSSYTMASLEFRYLLNTNSHFLLFGNIARTRNRANGANLTDFPYGFGAGLNLEVATGILTLAYALGSEQNNPIKLSTAKIHFGIINYL